MFPYLKQTVFPLNENTSDMDNLQCWDLDLHTLSRVPLWKLCVTQKVNHPGVARKTLWNLFTGSLKRLAGFIHDLGLKKKKLGETLYCSIIQSRKIMRSQSRIETEVCSQNERHERMEEWSHSWLWSWADSLHRYPPLWKWWSVQDKRCVVES